MSNKEFIKEINDCKSEFSCYATVFGFFALVITVLVFGTIYSCIPLVALSLIIFFTGVFSL